MLTKEQLSVKLGRVASEREYKAYQAMEKAIDDYICASLSATLDAEIFRQGDNMVKVDGVVMDNDAFDAWLMLKGQEKGYLKVITKQDLNNMGFDIPDLEELPDVISDKDVINESKKKRKTSKYDNNDCGEA